MNARKIALIAIDIGAGYTGLAARLAALKFNSGRLSDLADRMWLIEMRARAAHMRIHGRAFTGLLVSHRVRTIEGELWARRQLAREARGPRAKLRALFGARDGPTFVRPAFRVLGLEI